MLLGSKVARPDPGKATTLGLRRTDAGQAVRGLTPAPTAGLWLIPFCPGLFRSLVAWPEASLSQPRDIPQRERKRGLRGQRSSGTLRRGAFPLTQHRRAPGGSQAPSPVRARHRCPHIPWNRGTASYRLERGKTSALGVWTCPLSQVLFLLPSVPQDPSSTNLLRSRSGWDGSVPSSGEASSSLHSVPLTAGEAPAPRDTLSV